jgi:hypothetical protein
MISVSGPFLVRNNVVTANTGQGLITSGDQLVADYNDVFANAGGDYGTGEPGPNDVAADPLFVAPETGDYGLGLHSLCLDRGDPDPGCLDPDGSRADIGICGGPAAVALPPVRVLQATAQDLGAGTYRISWAAGTEPDLASYVVYRDTAAVFVPDPARVVGTVPHPDTSLEDTPPGPCYYVVVAVDSSGRSSGFSDPVNVGGTTPAPFSDLPRALAVTEVVPNPFNPRTTISYAVPQPAWVSVRIYDLRGRCVRELVSDRMEAGFHAVAWDGRDAHGGWSAAGVYLVRVHDGVKAATAKLVLAK